jgi:hypothetical protein
MNRSFNLLFGFLLIIGAICSGGYFGYGMAQDDGEPINRLIEIRDPRTAPPNFQPFSSKGGYTGFEGLPALTGKIYRSGVIADSSTDSFSVMSGGSKFDVSFRESPRIFEIRPSAQELNIGDLVMLRFSSEKELISILILPNDLQSIGQKSLTLNERAANAD